VPNTGYTPDIDSAAKIGDLERVQALLKNNPDLVLSKDRNGWTPLHWAAADGHKSVAELLLAHGADVRARDNRGETPLHKSAGNCDTVGNCGTVRMHWAAADGHKSVAELLLAHGADVNAKRNDGYTPLHLAGVWDHMDVLEVLLAKGADVNAKDNDGRTPLYFQGIWGYMDVLEVLLAKGADVNAKDNIGRTPLHSAVVNKNAEVIRVLLAKGADVNAKDNIGWTPLHCAAGPCNSPSYVLGSYKSVAELLLAHGADVRARNNHGETPLGSAIRSYRKDVEDILLAKRAENEPILNIIVKPEMLSFINSLGRDILFFTSKENPISRLADIVEPDSQFAVAEFSPRMIRLQQMLKTGSVASFAPSPEAVPFSARPVGETSMTGGGITLNGIGEDLFKDLFQRHPRLKFFATPLQSNFDSIEETGGGVRVRFIGSR
jgi:ankyrin repeat protein